MKLDPETIPAALRGARRWSVWRMTKEGRKRPKHQTNKPETWLPFDEACKVLVEEQGWDGVGVLMGEGLSGADFDNAYEDGKFKPEAKAVLDRFGKAYRERSPSGKGLKVFGLSMAAPLEFDFREEPHRVSKFKGARFFTVMGGGKGDPDVDVTGPLEALGPPEDRKPKRRQSRAADEETLIAELKRHDVLLGRRGDTVDVTCPWTSRHTGKTCGQTDAGFQVEEGRVVGFHCLHSSCEEKSLRDALAYFGLRAERDEAGFELDRWGRPRAVPANVRLAIEKLGVELWRDSFRHAAFYRRDGRSDRVDDLAVNRWRFESDSTFGLLVSKELFFDVVHDVAYQRQVHPVREYLSGLEWDEKPRLDSWLIDYAAAEDTLYNRAVGRLVLIAAVKRIRRPGVKFDELLILESGQGLEKSNALQALAGEWFSDSLPLGADPKVVIEGTEGVWIAEASEMHGHGRREADHLKAFLSRSVDGPVRLAYGRTPVVVPRQFVVVGTTNLEEYLKDSTGNRRYWPVRVGKFDVAALRADRDQLWAEAAVAEARGDSIRLDPSLWGEAGKRQDYRLVVDPWEEALRDRLGDGEGRVRMEDAWDAVGMPVERRTQADSERLGRVMNRLGFEKRKLRDGDKTFWGWTRGPSSAWQKKGHAHYRDGRTVDPTWLGRQEEM